jgi:hypothetical protein
MTNIVALARNIATFIRGPQAMNLDNASKRVAVATDVIKQIRDRKYVATEGSYLTFEGQEFDDSRDLKLAERISEIEGPNCHVCALGSMILSKTRLFGSKISVWNADSRDGIFRDLKKLFGEKQLTLIEDTFDGCSYSHYMYEYPDDNERLIAIMGNVVANKGTFVPEEKISEDECDCEICKAWNN